ncbi:hypothetical protein [Commensalibacter oyaizuii]|uniref:DUF4375 domain-containing protein n=1 Tax=Commensalibacter oyaizuii TaxID=3043873 RepID=A0ABT6Q0I5_9PROT|nr:hypothetical protein [Commensalibacter sp. TBRC 16381]MDI2090490.1 hypothetical protein [Commensalibacter sp. TBRC 16381]
MDHQKSEQKGSSEECVVHILDLSSEADDKVVEILSGFYNVEHANAFAHAYVRASVERCRIPAASSQEIFDAWSAFGEDAKVVAQDKADSQVWDSANEIMYFIENVATPMECDWRSIDPRRLVNEDDFPEDEE